MTWLRTLIWSLARNGMARDTDLRAQSQNATLIGQPCSSPTHFTFEPSAVGADTKAIALVSMHVRRPKPSVAPRSSGKDMKRQGQEDSASRVDLWSYLELLCWACFCLKLETTCY